MFIICTLYTLRICIFMMAIIKRNIDPDTKYSDYRVLKEGFIFEAITYLVFFATLLFVCFFSRYFKTEYSVNFFFF